MADEAAEELLPGALLAESFAGVTSSAERRDFPAVLETVLRGHRLERRLKEAEDRCRQLAKMRTNASSRSGNWRNWWTCPGRRSGP